MLHAPCRLPTTYKNSCVIQQELRIKFCQCLLMAGLLAQQLILLVIAVGSYRVYGTLTALGK